MGVVFWLSRLECTHVVRSHLRGLNSCQNAASGGRANWSNRKKMVEDGAFLAQRLHIRHMRMIVSKHRKKQGLVFAYQPNHRACAGSGESVWIIPRIPVAPHKADAKREQKEISQRLAKFLRRACVAPAVRLRCACGVAGGEGSRRSRWRVG